MLITIASFLHQDEVPKDQGELEGSSLQMGAVVTWWEVTLPGQGQPGQLWKQSSEARRSKNRIHTITLEQGLPPACSNSHLWARCLQE